MEGEGEEGRQVTESESSGCHSKPDPVQWRERFQAIGPLGVGIGQLGRGLTFCLSSPPLFQSIHPSIHGKRYFWAAGPVLFTRDQ